jgi:hypothetical protein
MIQIMRVIRNNSIWIKPLGAFHQENSSTWQDCAHRFGIPVQAPWQAHVSIGDRCAPAGGRAGAPAGRRERPRKPLHYVSLMFARPFPPALEMEQRVLLA